MYVYVNGATIALQFRVDVQHFLIVVRIEDLRAQVGAKHLVLNITVTLSFDAVEADALAESPNVEKNVEENDVGKKLHFVRRIFIPSGKSQID